MTSYNIWFSIPDNLRQIYLIHNHRSAQTVVSGKIEKWAKVLLMNWVPIGKLNSTASPNLLWWHSLNSFVATMKGKEIFSSSGFGCFEFLAKSLQRFCFVFFNIWSLCLFTLRDFSFSSTSSFALSRSFTEFGTSCFMEYFRISPVSFFSTEMISAISRMLRTSYFLLLSV